MSMQPESIINFEAYEDGVNFIGLANFTPPNIAFLTQQINGSGIMGNVDSVIAGMVEAMETTINFRSVTSAASRLMSPEKHQVDFRVAEQYWDTVNARKEIQADKFLMVLVPKSTNPGQIAPASASSASGTYSVLRYEGYKDGNEMWCIDPFNGICRVNGVDYGEPIRKALGKS